MMNYKWYKQIKDLCQEYITQTNDKNGLLMVLQELIEYVRNYGRQDVMCMKCFEIAVDPVTKLCEKHSLEIGKSD